MLYDELYATEALSVRNINQNGISGRMNVMCNMNFYDIGVMLEEKHQLCNDVGFMDRLKFAWDLWNGS